MGATYTAANVETNALDWVRLKLFDTDTSAAVLDDAEITAILALEKNKYFAAASLGMSIFAKWAQSGKGLVEKRIGMDLQWKWGKSASQEWVAYLQKVRDDGSLVLARTTTSRFFRVGR